MNEFLNELFNSSEITPLLILISIWGLPWKGVALWKASRNQHLGWFIALLLTNTAALLDALYIFYFSKKASRKVESKKAREDG